MDRSRLLGLAMVVLLSAPASAGLVEVPLPSLCGTYTADDSQRGASFDLGAPVDTVVRVWIRLSGVMTPGVAESMWSGAGPWPTQLQVLLSPVPRAWAYVGPYGGPFCDTTAIRILGDGSGGWTRLLSGAGEVILSLAPCLLEDGMGTVPPTVSVSAAALVLDTLVTSGGWTGLLPPVPNPVRSRVAIRYSVQSPGPLAIDLLDTSGRMVRRLVAGPSPAEARSVSWDLTDGRGARVPPGIYFCRMASGGRLTTRKVVVID